jgi:hypothetical protein
VGSENPVTEYLKTKTAASFGQGLMAGSGLSNPGRMGAALGRGAMGAAGALAVGGGVAAAGAIYDAATKSRDFRAMLEVNPDVAAKHEEDPRLVNRMFSTLRTFNPQFSKDPTVAGSYVRQMMEDPVHAGGKVVETLNFRDKMRSPMGDMVTRAALGGKKK